MTWVLCVHLITRVGRWGKRCEVWAGSDWACSPLLFPGAGQTPLKGILWRLFILSFVRSFFMWLRALHYWKYAISIISTYIYISSLPRVSRELIRFYFPPITAIPHTQWGRAVCWRSEFWDWKRCLFWSPGCQWRRKEHNLQHTHWWVSVWPIKFNAFISSDRVNINIDTLIFIEATSHTIGFGLIWLVGLIQGRLPWQAAVCTSMGMMCILSSVMHANSLVTVLNTTASSVRV